MRSELSNGPPRSGFYRDSRAVLAWTILLALTIYGALRFPHLRDLPVFCDEASYLHWAQMVRQHPIADGLVSFQDAKPPLHYWILALVLPLQQDPVYVGRLVSVFFGAIAIFPLVLLCRELAKLADAPRLLTPLVLLFVISCPLVAFSQRLAIAESLLVLEAISLAWLSLRLARRAAEGVSVRWLLLDGCLLGLLWGLTLLTKQDFSYALWVLPAAAVIAHARKHRLKSLFRGFLPAFCVATAVGLACFGPLLLIPSEYSLATRFLYKGHFLRDVAHRGRFSIFSDNALSLFVPTANGHLQLWPYDLQAPLDDGWLYVYLTPPVLLLAVLGFCWLLWRSQWRPLVFLAAWGLALLAPLLLVNRLFSRYAVLGCLPVLICAAWLLADLLQRAAASANRRILLPMAGLAGLVAIAWPLAATTATVLNCRAPTLTRADRFQHLSGFPCGEAAEHVVARLNELAEKCPITVVTTDQLGVYNEYVWLMLANNPRVQMLREDTLFPVRSGPDTYVAMTRQWAPRPLVRVQIPAERPIYVVSSGNRSATGVLDVSPDAVRLGPDARTIETYVNPAETPGDAPTFILSIIEIYSSRGSGAPPPPPTVEDHGHGRDLQGGGRPRRGAQTLWGTEPVA